MKAPKDAASKAPDPKTDIDWRRDWARLLGGGLVTLAVVIGTAAVSAWPDWQSLPEGSAVLRVSFQYSGQRDCRTRTEEELAALPRNMRLAEECSRRRNPVGVAIMIDGSPLYDETVKPSGLAGSGPSRLYETFVLPAGDHGIHVSLRPDANSAVITHEAEFTLSLAPGMSAAIDFDSTAGAFVLR